MQDPTAPLRSHTRAAWIPITQAGEDHASPNKFGGQAWFLPRSRPPTCFECKGSLSLALQLKMSTLPDELLRSFRRPELTPGFLAQLEQLKKAFKIKYDYIRVRRDPIGEGLFQAFVCASPDCLTDFERGTSQYRFLPASDCKPRKSPADLPARTILGWRREEELPLPDEWDRLGIRVSDAERAWAEDEADPHEGDKLSGWPRWAQAAVAPPGCGVCSAPKDFFVQLASNDNLPVSFGDEGKTYVFLCPVCPDYPEPMVQYY